jgi:hypothetical protein
VAASHFLLPVHTAKAQTESDPPIRFRDISRASGIDPHGTPLPEKRYILEMMGGGIALFDCNNDGKLDILVVNDSSVDEFRHGGGRMITLYRQDSDPHSPRSGVHFSDTTVQSGLTTRGWGMGVTIGDFDNDGLPDIYVTGYGHNVLYRNLGDCKFQDVTERAHLSGGGFSAGAAWADYDSDGLIDLFVSRYIDSDIQHLPQAGSSYFNYKGQQMEVPTLNGQTDLLYRNRGDGTFEEVSEKAGVSNPDKRLGMGVVWADYDNDGWPDLLVTNDMGPNFLYHNNRNGTFDEVGLWAGMAVSDQGAGLGNMAADFADIDHSGKLDLLITRYMHQPMSLYQYRGAPGFADITRESKLGVVSDQAVRWGAGFADFDNDGWPDILVANGNFTSLTDSVPSEPKYGEPLQIFRNNGNRTFTEVTGPSGLNAGGLESRRGTAFGDINNDGNVDAAVYNAGGPPSIFLNVTGDSNHRVLFKLAGTRSNRAAIGARVTVTTVSPSGALVDQMDEVRGGGSYLSCNDQRLHFGLGSAGVMKRVRIRWPSGLNEEFRDVPSDALYTLVEGRGITQTSKLNLLAK